jgi:dolichol-phosphate mannosyltransferase
LKSIDIITAVRDEEQCIPPFVESVSRLPIPEFVSLGIIFVEDSSTDATVRILREISKSRGNVRFYSLARGFGEGPAVVFGMSRSSADAVIMMGVDGGHPPGLIPRMIDYHLAGADLVQAVRLTLKKRRIYRDAGAALFRAVARAITGVNLAEQNVYYRLVSRAYKDMIVDTKKWAHFLRLRLPRNSSGCVQKIYFHSEERKLGRSKYTLLRLAGLSLDGVLSLVSAPRLAALTVLLAAAGLSAAVAVHPFFSLPFVLIIVLILLRYYWISHDDILGRMKAREEG